MSGHEGRIRPEKKVYVTLMGGCELVRPTLAKQILAKRQQGREPNAHSNWQFFLTIMGGTELRVPTLAEEFLDMQELLRNGIVSREGLERGITEILSQPSISVSSFTLMGNFSELELPSENEEIDGLALHRHLGNIPDQAGEVLQYGIGQQEGERWATLRRAMQTV
jgi:hypothetical protein